MAVGGVFSRFITRHSPAARARGTVLKHFSQTIGLVYFGTVDRKTDEYDDIRGITVSTTHKDEHYAVGSYDGYDISVVDRYDVVTDRNRVKTEQNWVILQLSLESNEPLPHLFMHPLGQQTQAYDKFFDSTHQLQVVNSIFRGGHSQEFHNRYELYSTSTHALSIEELFTPIVTQTIAARLWPHAIEILNNKLYVYTIESKLTETLLEAAISSALWLARVLDKSEEN
ncbi:MAG: hypothetical protein ABIP50_02990 [Candidatus Saccharimonadales bacterium]